MSFKNIFKPEKHGSEGKKGDITQSAVIDGDGNSVNQINIQHADTVIVEGERSASSHRRISIDDQKVQKELMSNAGFVADDDDTSPIGQRITNYRKIADDGDPDRGIQLLESLLDNEVADYAYFSFRIRFNIGIIFNNYGKLPEAVKNLRVAYQFCPENLKARTGLAFADLLEGKNNEALEQSCELLKTPANHTDFAAFVAFHAAKRDGRKLDPSIYEECDFEDKGLLVAYLEYMQTVEPESYPEQLAIAFAEHGSDGIVAVHWAYHVLDDFKRNHAFLLGARVSDDFISNIKRCADILEADLENMLRYKGHSVALLPYAVNNTAVAMRLAGRIRNAAQLVDKAISMFPEILPTVHQARASLYLEEDQEAQALEFINQFETDPELQIMAAEIEAKMGSIDASLTRVNQLLNESLPTEHKQRALITKAKVGLNGSRQEACEEALDDLSLIEPESPQLTALRSAFDRAFNLKNESELQQIIGNEIKEESYAEQKLLASLKDAGDWDFPVVLQTADELFARKRYRECVDLLKDRTNFGKLSPALDVLCDASLLGGFAQVANEISQKLSPEIKDTVFGLKFEANVGFLTGKIDRTIPVTRKLFEHDPKALGALRWYVQSLFRKNKHDRIRRLVGGLDDSVLTGTVDEKLEYVKILVFCGEIDRARNLAYKLYCQRRNDPRSWTAISASVLAFNRPPNVTDEFKVTTVEKDAAFEVQILNGGIQKFIIEFADDLFPSREENIDADHPIAKTAMGKSVGDEFHWPFGNSDKTAKIVSVKHKVLDAFHHICANFEEKFPQASGFKSVKMDFEAEDGLEEFKAHLRSRAEYSQMKSKDYYEGQYPLSILGFHLGLDQIDAFLGIKTECNIGIKTSSSRHDDQAQARESIEKAQERGILLDPVTCYLVRRLELIGEIESVFGRIAITQNTLDIFSNRANEAVQLATPNANGNGYGGNVSIRDERIVLRENTEDSVSQKAQLTQSDVAWLEDECELVAALPKVDPPDEIIQFRNQEGGSFFDDMFASDGADRILISEDFHLRQWANQLFGCESAWLQAILLYLNDIDVLSTKKLAKSTINLIEVGEEKLSINARMLFAASEMLADSELEQGEMEVLCRLFGGKQADMYSHLGVATEALEKIWCNRTTTEVKEPVTGILLRNLTRQRHADYKEILEVAGKLMPTSAARQYIADWRKGHFLT